MTVEEAARGFKKMAEIFRAPFDEDEDKRNRRDAWAINTEPVKVETSWAMLYRLAAERASRASTP